jgi:tetratricopeptide (TPR) repeat protein
VVHRDVKPDNVLLSGKHALVTDFGVAKAVASSSGTGGGTLTSLGMALGTPAYMAPEQAAGDPNVDYRADLYAVGALGYELLAGRTPFGGLSPQGLLAAQVTATPDPVTQHRDSVPPALAALIMRCLEKHPADRPQGAEEIVGQLEAMATPTGATLAEPSPISSGTAAAIRRAHPVRVAMLFALAAVGVLALAHLLVRLLGLPDWAFAGAVAVAAAGFPVFLWTGVLERRRALARHSGRSPAVGGVHHWFTWRRALLSGAGAFGLLGFGTAVYMAMRLLGIGPVGTLVASGVLAARERLVLADFENRTRDSTLGPSLTEALRVDLAQSRVIRLLDAAAVGQALARMGRSPGTPLDPALARELAQREGAKAVVHGQIDPLGRGYVVSAELVSAADGTALVSLRETAQDDGAIIAAVDRLSHRLRERIGESLKTIRASDPLEQVTTSSLDALRKYSQAVKANDAGEFARATGELEQAIALDTTFAMAYRKLAVVLNNTGGPASRIAAAATQAYRHRDRLTPLERDLAEAFYYYRGAEFDRSKVESAYRSALELDPENFVALNNLALTLSEQRRFAEAESLSVHGIAVAPNPTLYVNAAAAQVGQGKLAAAGRTVAAFVQKSPTNPLSFFLRAGLTSARRDFDSAAIVVKAEAQLPDLAMQEGAISALAFLELVRGRVAQAEVDSRRAMEIAVRRGLPGSYVSDAVGIGIMELFYRNAPDAGRRIVEDALGRYPLASIPAGDRPYLFLAWFYAQAGRADRAKQLLAEYTAMVPEALRKRAPFRHGAAAAVALAEGRVQDAIAGYRAWYDEDNCAACGLYLLGRVYERAGEPDSAIAVYERAVNTPGLTRMFDEAFTLGATYRSLGELYEQRGQADKARDYYGRFVDLWKGADPELQPLVRDVRARIVRLSAEPLR